MPDADLIVTTARIAHHDLVAAECASLTGGRPDADGVATAHSLDTVARAAYVHDGMRVIARARSFDALVDRVAASDVDADRFRVDVHDPGHRIGATSLEVAVRLADVLPYFPDLDDPRHRFVVVAQEDQFVFGEVVARSDGAYRRHDTKPWSTSSSLDARFSRALVNLVPTSTSILDPCCGAGSIVLEAASLGLVAFAVDWKPAMVGMTRTNLAHFGYDADVTRADSRTHRQHADAIVTDLPYGHAIHTDEASVRAILENGATCAPLGVYVAPQDISSWLDAAGYETVAVHTVQKRAGFTRWIHVAEARRR
ncbi:MAG: methyltransferase [Ilumatobacter sp.]|nr:methyltransferase [Ilumatobacter sp.]